MRIPTTRTRTTRAGLAAGLAAIVVGGVTGGLLSPDHAAAQETGGFDFSQPDVVATGLQIPWGMDFLPDGSALVTERGGRVLRVSVDAAPQVVGTIPNVDPDGEGGLLGLAVSPTFSQDGWVYVYHTSPSDNRVVRFQLASPQNPQPVITGIPRGTIIHNGGRIEFGPDGMLYVATGDAGVGSNAQNPNSLAGKILRTTPTGAAAPGNPTPGSRVYSLGHRNVQGMAWDDQGRLWATEFGQNQWDEVNLIMAGGNYGWPTCEGFCTSPQPNFIDPLHVWTTAEASPSGAAIANDHLFVAGLRGQRLWVVPLQGADVGEPTAELVGAFGRLRAVEVGPDGWLWLTTSNRDGRGNPVPADDRVVRFPPADPPIDPTDPPIDPTDPPIDPTEPPTGDCEVGYQVANQWPGGFQANVTVTNTGSGPIQGWRVQWTFLDGQVISQLWNGVHSQTGASVTVDNMTWNGALAPNASTSFGFLGSWSNPTNRAPGDISCSTNP